GLRFMQLEDRGIGLAKAFEKNFQQAHSDFRVRLQVLHEVVPMQFTGSGLLDGNDGGAARLFVNHAHLTEGLALSDVSQMYVFAFQVLTDFDASLLDNVRSLSYLVFNENRFSWFKNANPHRQTLLGPSWERDKITRRRAV